MRIVLIALVTILFGCNSRTKQTESTSEELSHNGFLLPRLLADKKSIWDYRGRKSEDTLSRKSYNFSFEVLNYSKYTDKSLDNPLLGISDIDFKIQTSGLDTILNPTIQDSIGFLTLNLDTLKSPSLKYFVDMNLKFKKTDSTFKYLGVIYLQD